MVFILTIVFKNLLLLLNIFYQFLMKGRVDMKWNVIPFLAFLWHDFDRTHQCLKCDISDSKSPSNFCRKCQNHFCVLLISQQYAYQLHILAHDTYVSKMCSSWVIIEMVIGKCLKKDNFI